MQPAAAAPSSKQIQLTVDDLAQMVDAIPVAMATRPHSPGARRLVESKMQEEVLYREGLAMGLEKDDTIVKRRMAQKLQFLAEDVATAREPEAAELRSWFEKNNAMFAQPSRVSFRHLYFSPDRRGERARDDAAKALAKLAGQPQDAKLAASLADPFMFQDYYRDRAPEYLRQGVRAAVRAGGCETSAGIMAGADRVRLWLAPGVRRYSDSGPGAGLRGDRGRRKDRMARRAEGAGVGEGVQGDAGEVHGAVARAA